jgi:hypothetical protein
MRTQKPNGIGTTYEGVPHSVKQHLSLLDEEVAALKKERHIAQIDLFLFLFSATFSSRSMCLLFSDRGSRLLYLFLT